VQTPASDTTESSPVRPAPAILARTLRHEVCDLLQTLYAGVAILQKRLPAEAPLERRLLMDLRGRAETCLSMVDAVVDLVSLLPGEREPVDLAALLERLLPSLRARYRAAVFLVEGPAPLWVAADPRRLEQVLTLLLQDAGQMAQPTVQVRWGPTAEQMAELLVQTEGLGASDEQLVWLTDPFASPDQARFGIPLALARRFAALHGGSFRAGNRPEGGFALCLRLPLADPTT